MIYLELMMGFLKVGFFAFGGAYAAIPLMRDVVMSYGWLTEDALSYMIAVSESTPGPIMVNLATYVGSSQGGLLGAFIATTSVVLPAFFIIILVMVIFKALLKNDYFQAILGGLKPAVVGVILATGVYMMLNNALHVKTGMYFDPKAIILTILLSAMMFVPMYFKKKMSPILLIAISAVLGMIFYAF